MPLTHLREKQRLPCFLVRRTLVPRTAFLLIVLFSLSACFSEHSFPLHPERVVHLPPSPTSGDPLSTRQWALAMHTAATPLLPNKSRDTLLTDDLAASDVPVDVWSHFQLNPAQLDSIWYNLDGIEQTAQVTSPPTIIEAGHIRRAPWLNFQPIEVPVTNDLSLPARIGIPDPRKEIKGSYIIITHGLFGTLDGV